MQLRSPVRSLARLSAVALVGASLALVAPAAQAAPVFSDADTYLDPAVNPHTSAKAGAPGATNCTMVLGGGGAGANVPVVENGPEATSSASVSASFADTNVPTDTGSGNATTTATAKVASAGGNLRTMHFTANSSAQVTTPATSNCDRMLNSSVNFFFRFTVAQAGFLSVDMANRGMTHGVVALHRIVPSGTDQPNYENDGEGMAFDSDSKIYLPAGTYAGRFGGSVTVNNAATKSGSTTVHAEFTVAGSMTEAVSGKGKRYVKFPATRSCATDSVNPSITDKRKRADKIKQVKFFVNDKMVKKVRTPDKGDTAALPVADNQVADVVAEVKLFPTRKGRPGRVLEVSTAYEACS